MPVVNNTVLYTQICYDGRAHVKCSYTIKYFLNAKKNKFNM